MAWPASDQLLAQLAERPETFAAWTADPAVKRLGRSFHEEWQSVDGLLASVAPRPGLPWSALVEGDLAYPGLADRGAHGLRARTVEQLGAALAAISRADAEACATRAWADFAARTGRDPRLTPAQLATEVSELWAGLARLRQVVATAQASALGLLVARWEDW